MAFFILLLLSAQDLDIGQRDDISRGLMTRAIWKRPCINLFITYFARVDNILLPFKRGQKSCYCPRKMLLPWRQITRRKLCFYYTCKFGVISIKYVINREYYMALSVSHPLSTRDTNIIPRVLAWRMILVESWYGMWYGKSHIILCLSYT